MNKPMTRRGCVVGVLLWAMVMALPVCALVFAVRGEVNWRRGAFVEDRLWIVRADEGSRGERPGGLAYSAQRITSGRPGDGGAVCVTTRVYFWLWRGPDERLTYCECYLPAEGGQYQAAGECR
jgi:hypothetical protein